MEGYSGNLVNTIRESYEKVLSRISQAASSCNRPPDSVKLVVVSKTQPMEIVRAAIAAGVRTFGENYAEEAVAKISVVNETGVEWHMIGHVQSRKANLVAENFSLVHSLDSVKLATRLDRFCNQFGKRLPVLLEFNLSGEETKSGFTAQEENQWQILLPEVEGILACPNLVVRGLMTMPPLFDDPERTRPYFVRLNHLRDYLARQFPRIEWSDLSMGTSTDYVIAIQEGATIVRIGTAILGPRQQ